MSTWVHGSTNYVNTSQCVCSPSHLVSLIKSRWVLEVELSWLDLFQMRVVHALHSFRLWLGADNWDTGAMESGGCCGWSWVMIYVIHGCCEQSSPQHLWANHTILHVLADCCISMLRRCFQYYVTWYADAMFMKHFYQRSLSWLCINIHSLDNWKWSLSVCWVFMSCCSEPAPLYFA